MPGEFDDKDRRILEFIDEQPGGFAGTAEVAEEIGLTTNGAAYRLKSLRDVGEVDSRIVSRDEVWYLIGDADGQETGLLNTVRGVMKRA